MSFVVDKCLLIVQPRRGPKCSQGQGEIYPKCWSFIPSSICFPSRWINIFSYYNIPEQTKPLRISHLPDSEAIINILHSLEMLHAYWLLCLRFHSNKICSCFHSYKGLVTFIIFPVFLAGVEEGAHKSVPSVRTWGDKAELWQFGKHGSQMMTQNT